MPVNGSASLKAVVLKALEPNPMKRYQSAAQMRDALINADVNDSPTKKPKMTVMMVSLQEKNLKILEILIRKERKKLRSFSKTLFQRKTKTSTAPSRRMKRRIIPKCACVLKSKCFSKL